MSVFISIHSTVSACAVWVQWFDTENQIFSSERNHPNQHELSESGRELLA